MPGRRFKLPLLFAIVQAYGILGMPTTVFMTAKGEVFKTHTGILSEAQLVRLIDELLQAPGQS